MDIQDLKNTDFIVLSAEIIKENPILISKIETATEVSKEEVPQLLAEVLRFLFLIEFSQQILTPSHIVDLAWHELILCTRYYAEFCNKHFGRFIHHHPGGLEEENHRQFHQTLKLYSLTFETIPEIYWGPMATKINEASACGSCSS